MEIAALARLRKAALLGVGLSFALTGCMPPPSLDASSAEKLSRSLDAYVKASDDKNRATRKQAADIIRTTYLQGKTFAAELPGDAPPLDAFHKLRYREVFRTAMKVKEWADHGMRVATRPPLQDTPIERRWRNQFVVGQLEVQEKLLLAKRDRGQYDDLFTVDQFQYTDSNFIPPQADLPIGQDKAVFTTKFKNTSGFNIYAVGFHIKVQDPAFKSPLIDDVYTYTVDKDPIQVGETRQIEVSCCDSFSNPTVNLALRSLPQDALIDISLAKVVDYSKRNRLEGAVFSPEDSLRLMATQVCLADIRSRIENWEPATADPGCEKY